MTRVERNNKLKHFIACLKCEVSGKCCDDNCPTQYDAGNMGEIIENLEAISKALEQELVLGKIRAEIEEIEKNYGFDKATKYGNKNAEQQCLSYSTLMMYEVADIIDEIKEIIDKYKAESEDKE